MMAAAGGNLSPAPAPARPGTAVCVVLASGGYPDVYPAGLDIRGLERLDELQDVVAFHAGTKEAGQRIVTAGGRVLGVTAFGSDGLKQTIERAYLAVEKISFQGMHYRRDIGKKALDYFKKN